MDRLFVRPAQVPVLPAMDLHVLPVRVCITLMVLQCVKLVHQTAQPATPRDAFSVIQVTMLMVR